jgi:hypothetical protein
MTNAMMTRRSERLCQDCKRKHPLNMWLAGCKQCRILIDFHLCSNIEDIVQYD